MNEADKAAMRGVDRYTVKVWWSPVDDCFVGQVLELPGCMADGTTRATCLRMLDQVALRWIEATEKLGRAVPPPACGKL